MLISEKTIFAINDLSRQCFWINRVVDRAVSILSTDFACSQASKILHEGLAHKYPLLADKVNEILEKLSEDIVYLETPKDDRVYDDLTAIFQSILDENVVLYERTKKVYDVAIQEGDIHVVSHILEVMEDITNFLAQTSLLRDKAEQMNDEPAMFDLTIPTFFTLE